MQVLPARRRRPILARQVEAAADAVRGGNAGSNTEQGCNTRSLVGPQGIESLRAGAQAKHKILEECAPRKHAHEPGGADCLINGPTMRLIRLEPSPCLWTSAGRIAPTRVHAGGSTCRPAADCGPVYTPYLENVSDRCRLRQWTSNDLALSKSQNIGLAVAEARQHLVVMLTKLGCRANAGRSLRK